MQEITITFPDGTTKNFPVGITIYDVAKTYQEKLNSSILGAKINNEIISLGEKLNQNTTISFMTVMDPYGYRMYQGALKFIFEVATKTTFPNCEVLFLHSVPKGIMASIEGKNIIKDDLNKIKEEMAKIIRNDEKIIKYNVSKSNAINYFKEHNQLEKAENIHNTNVDIVRLYKLRNIYNYYYTELPYSTSCISKFDLVYLGKNKIVLVFPSSRTSGSVPEYVHYDRIIDTFLDGQKWLETMKVPYLPNLNYKISHGGIKELIVANELVFNEHIYKVVDEIYERKNIKVVLIAGPSSTGKTTTNQRLSSYFRAIGYEPITISLDDYYKNRNEVPRLENGDYDYETIDSLDIKAFNEDIDKLLNGKDVYLPTYNFVIKEKKRSKFATTMQENSILLIEGLHCLNDILTENVPNEIKFKIYLSPFIPLRIDRHNYISTVDLRLLRRIIRDNRTRDTDVAETIGMWQAVRDGEEKYIFPYVHQADALINTAYMFEVGVLKVFAEPLLYSVEITSPYYQEARRLLKSLEGFYPIPSEYISKDSILREFIG